MGQEGAEGCFGSSGRTQLLQGNVASELGLDKWAERGLAERVRESPALGTLGRAAEWS